MKRFLLASLVALAAFVPTHSQTVNPATEPLLTSANLVYQGGFRLPRTNDNNTYAYGGTGLSYRASNNALIVVGHDWYQEVGEVTVPTPGTATFTPWATQSCTQTSVQPSDLTQTVTTACP